MRAAPSRSRPREPEAVDDASSPSAAPAGRRRARARAPPCRRAAPPRRGPPRRAAGVAGRAPSRLRASSPGGPRRAPRAGRAGCRAAAPGAAAPGRADGPTRASSAAAPCWSTSHLLGARSSAAPARRRGMVELREVAPARGPSACPPRAPTAWCAGAAACWSACCTVGGGPVVARVAQPARDRVVLGAWGPDRRGRRGGAARMRFALGVDDDLRAFYARFRDDPLIGRSVRAPPVPAGPPAARALRGARLGGLRAAHRVRARRRHPAPDRRAALGPPCPRDRAARRARRGGARRRGAGQLEAFGLSPGRALALRRAAREVAAGRVDLRARDHEAAGARLRAIPGIGAWTSRCSRSTGRGATTSSRPPTSVPAARRPPADGGDPRAKASEDEVRALFAPYGRWAASPPPTRSARARSGPRRGVLRLQPLARQELRRQRPARSPAAA